MQILCDHNVAGKYVDALKRERWTVRTVSAELSPTASDQSIATYASANDWVVFTTDDDFYANEITHGLIEYIQVEDPRPGTVVDAIGAIDEAYRDPDDVNEVVPDGWIE